MGVLKNRILEAVVMGSYTAQILVGSGHPNGGGVIPSHLLFLSENSRPAWILTALVPDDQEGSKTITWIPTLEHILEDALLLISVYVLKEPEICALAKEAFADRDLSRVTLYDDIQPEKLQALRVRCRSLDMKYKLVITVCDSSSIGRDLSALAHYGMDVEVCTPKYVRFYSEWRNEIVEQGSL